MRDKLPALGVELKRRPFDERGRSDDDAGGVHADMTHASFDAASEIEYFADILIFLVERLQIALKLERPLYRHRESLGADGNEFCDAIAGPVGVAERARNVAYRGSREHGSERANLRDAILAISPLRIRDHFVATIIRDVHINIRGLWTLGVQESLKREVVKEGIDVRDTDQIGNQRAGGASARRREDVLLACESKQISDGKIVGSEPLSINDAELIFDAFFDLGSFGETASSDTAVGLQLQFFGMRLTFRKRDIGECPCS